MTIERSSSGNNGYHDMAERMARYLARFFNDQDPYSAAYIRVLSLLEEDPSLSKGQVFNTVADGLGNGKQHCSGKPEGGVKRS